MEKRRQGKKIEKGSAKKPEKGLAKKSGKGLGKKTEKNIGRRLRRDLKEKLSDYRRTEIMLDRRIADLKKLDPIRLLAKKADLQVQNGEYEVPVRIFFPAGTPEPASPLKYHGSVFLFLHGGGWATESVDTYERICTELSSACAMPVLAVEYRRAPEHRFPAALSDCYAAADALFKGRLLPLVRPDQITLIGDSAGGNLAAALSLMAKDRGEFLPERQILIYPALWNDYTERSPYPSVAENAKGYLLTSAKMEEYLELYQRTPADRQNEYFAPLLRKDLSGMPRTLVLTAEKDPLRDEGEAYAERLSAAGNEASLYRIKGAQHGFFALGIRQLHVEESLKQIRSFMQQEEGDGTHEKA